MVGIESPVARQLQSAVGEAVNQTGVFDLVLDGRIAPRNGTDVSPCAVNGAFLLTRIGMVPEAFQGCADLSLVVGLLNCCLRYEAVQVGCPGDESVEENFDDCLAESQQAVRTVAPFPFEEVCCLAARLELLRYCFH